ncbi:hypothetical protein VTL71DRAFT_10358 [Oculimacula yallundae]|uniref:Lipoprotein n=1 Tax=Oculimacula yallundae TaxID=86028 RepID=A0ABR4CT15_9HELO
MPIPRPRPRRQYRIRPIIKCPGESLGRFAVMALLQGVLAGCAAVTVWPHLIHRDGKEPKDSR